MLVLTRYPDESVEIRHNGQLIGRVMVVETDGYKVRLGFDFEKEYVIWRPEYRPKTGRKESKP